MRELESILDELSEQDRLMSEYGVERIGVFGSYARGEQDRGSDLDLLVEFERPVSLFELGELEDRLEDELGARVDLVTREGLRPRIREEVLKDVVYS